MGVEETQMSLRRLTYSRTSSHVGKDKSPLSAVETALMIFSDIVIWKKKLSYMGMHNLTVC